MLVLVVGRDDVLRSELCDFLRAAGFRTCESESANEALWVAGERVPDVIVVDSRFPQWQRAELAEGLEADAKLASIPLIELRTPFGAPVDPAFDPAPPPERHALN